MSKEKLPSEEGDHEESKGYMEIDFSRLKDKLADGYERLVFGGISRKFSEGKKKGEGRLGLDPIFFKLSVACLIGSAIVLLCCAAFGADADVQVFVAFLLLLCLSLTVICLYEIRYDQNGFSTRFGKRILREYKWSDVTDVQGDRKVWVQGKRLLTDHTFDDFPEFYKMARAACKGKGKPTPPSEKKKKARQKPPTKPH